MGSPRAAADESAEATRRTQRAVWCLLAIIASAEITFGLWLVNLASGR